MRLLPIVVLAALLLPGVATADHVYSHRFVFEGRLLGSDDTPIPGRTVTFFAEGDDFLEPCPGDPGSATTNQWGDFRFCFHKHDLHAATTVGVTAGNATIRKVMDTAFRRSIVILREPNETGIAPPDWDSTFHILGKVWRQGATELEGVQVYGSALAGVAVNVTLTTPDGDGSAFQVWTDAYGDFVVPLRLLEGQTPAEVRVQLETLGHRRTYALDERTHRVTAGFLLPEVERTPVSAQFPGDTTQVQAPGATSPPMSPVMLMLIGLGLVGTVFYLRRKE